jgi:hypothetical protein
MQTPRRLLENGRMRRPSLLRVRKVEYYSRPWPRRRRGARRRRCRPAMLPELECENAVRIQRVGARARASSFIGANWRPTPEVYRHWSAGSSSSTEETPWLHSRDSCIAPTPDPCGYAARCDPCGTYFDDLLALTRTSFNITLPKLARVLTLALQAIC